ncbi:hypothetical protein RIF29_24060 [Crotalaria pallida]|uniref:Uncharacterized protein n=1 Tax=Crotalaria pallida TaxID=3830 RepID=A0AAN9ELH8_CROPI
MGSEAEEQHSKIPKLPLFSIIPPMKKSPERSGMLTPPLHASASVPFNWEQEPGKPRPCTALVTFCDNNLLPKCLELPPRLLLPSPTTVLEGPYVGEGSRNSNRFQCPSFRMSNEEVVLGSLDLTKGGGIKDKGWWFCSRRKNAFKVKRDVSGGSYVFPSSVEKEAEKNGVGGTHNKVKMSKIIKRSESFSNLSYGKSHFWVRLRVYV